MYACVCVCVCVCVCTCNVCIQLYIYMYRRVPLLAPLYTALTHTWQVLKLDFVKTWISLYCLRQFMNIIKLWLRVKGGLITVLYGMSYVVLVHGHYMYLHVHGTLVICTMFILWVEHIILELLFSSLFVSIACFVPLTCWHWAPLYSRQGHLSIEDTHF